MTTREGGRRGEEDEEEEGEEFLPPCPLRRLTLADAAFSNIFPVMRHCVCLQSLRARRDENGGEKMRRVFCSSEENKFLIKTSKKTQKLPHRIRSDLRRSHHLLLSISTRAQTSVAQELPQQRFGSARESSRAVTIRRVPESYSCVDRRLKSPSDAFVLRCVVAVEETVSPGPGSEAHSGDAELVVRGRDRGEGSRQRGWVARVSSSCLIAERS